MSRLSTKQRRARAFRSWVRRVGERVGTQLRVGDIDLADCPVPRAVERITAVMERAPAFFGWSYRGTGPVVIRYVSGELVIGGERIRLVGPDGWPCPV